MKTEELPVQMMELNNYIDSLFVQLDVAFAAKMRHSKFEMLAMLTLFLSVFSGQGWIMSLAWLVFWVAHSHGYLVLGKRLDYLFGEIDGCFKTLEILGILEKGSWTGRKNKKTKSIFASIVKGWQDFKEKVQKEMWGVEAIPVPAMSILR